MNLQTIIDIPRPPFQIEPFEELLFVGSCFADNIGQRFASEHFPAEVNPFGVMYNPVSVLHTLQRVEHMPRVVFITLGTNHVYRLKETGEIVDNCRKMPQTLFQEEELTREQCADFLAEAVALVNSRHEHAHVVITVSPIRYRKYGYHASQLSKATLLLAADDVCRSHHDMATYFPAYEIVLDELRDYRFYQPDMIHPSPQAVDYIWERLAPLYLSEQAQQAVRDWQPIKAALNHRPFDEQSHDYQLFFADAKRREKDFLDKYTTQA